ncbi:MAG: rhodanese-like domain-containing protein [Candidatus Eisenbacteria bacterium]|nr:rhodanese-like domain-containing protein [Candidatus Eisenbacteria bacterium]
MPHARNLKGFLLRTTILVGVSSLTAVMVNAFRSDSLDWVAAAEYEIYEECPESTEPATPVTLDELRENPDYFLVIDCRDEESFVADHLEGSISIPYDPLFPVDEEAVLAIRESVGDRTVVVVGDSMTAKLLADDLIAQGIEWVQYLEDGQGWPALLHGGREHDSR